MVTIDTPFSTVKHIHLSECGLSETSQQVKWLNTIDRCLNNPNYVGEMRGQRIHFERERKKTEERIARILKNQDL